jgi:DNA-binding IclR family transcriptional regulator
MSGRNRDAGRSVLSKAFAILDAMRAAETALTRAQIARRTGLPMTTVYRLANELRRQGALEMTDRGRYRVGPWLWEVGTLTPHTSTLRDAALPFMEDLSESTHENVTLAVLDGTRRWSSSGSMAKIGVHPTRAAASPFTRPASERLC